MPHEVTTTDSGDILVCANAVTISLTERFSALATSAVFANATFVSASFTDAFLLNDARIRVTAAAPTIGTHATGDIAFNSSPAAGGQVGWVNTAGGTPGTWKTFGLIESA